MRLYRRLRRLPRRMPAKRPGRRSMTVYERIYPFGWLGILSEAAPAGGVDLRLSRARLCPVLACAGRTAPLLPAVFAGRGRKRLVRRRAFWDELSERLGDGGKLKQGPVVESVAPMRSFVAEPMQFGRLFLAGDAAHIVPPTGAKGLNLAWPTWVLSRALGASTARSERRARYLSGRLPAPRVESPALLVVDDLDAAPLHRRRLRGLRHERQLAELDYVTSSRAAGRVAVRELRGTADGLKFLFQHSAQRAVQQH